MNVILICRQERPTWHKWRQILEKDKRNADILNDIDRQRLYCATTSLLLE
jgi:sigma54-dependent transcription regulator